MALVPTKYSCMYCGEYFNAVDSTARNTPKLMANMYCSKECHDKDTEEIEHQIALLRNDDSAVDRLSADSDATAYKTVEVGGFRLKVPIKKEGV